MGCSHAKPRPVAPELAARRRFCWIGVAGGRRPLAINPRGRARNGHPVSYSRATLVSHLASRTTGGFVVMFLFFVVLVVFIQDLGAA